MSSNGNGKLGFGDFKLDPGARLVWYKDQTVELPLKAVDLLCLLIEKRGDVVTKDEIWKNVWNDTFVEETNLTHNIYLLRKTFRELGAGELIKTVPRRGYRFVGDVAPTNGCHILYERSTVTDTFIEEVTFPAEKSATGRIGKLSLVVASLALFGVVALFAAWWAQVAPFSTASSGVRSIAVLPFAQLDQTTDADRQGVVLADSLITRLSNLKSLRISSITAVTDVDRRDPIAAGKVLDVDAVLVGTIYRSGDKTRVSARILKVSDGKALWAGELERSDSENIRLHNDLAMQITNALALHLDPAEKRAMAKSYTEDPDAFRLYQEARFEWNKRNRQGAAQAAQLFRHAIQKDPKFASAYAGLAEVVALSDSEEAETIAVKALDLDPDLAEAHASLGFIHTFVHRNWSEAERSLTRSIEINANYAQARHWYAELLAIMGRNAEAKAEMERALALNPRSHNYLAGMGQIYYFNREYKEAESYCRRALELDPEFAFAHEYLADIYLQTGEFEKAVDARLTAERIHGRLSIDSDDRTKRRLAAIEEKRAHALTRGKDEFLKSLLTDSKDPVAAYYDARRYAGLGNREMTLLLLEKSIETPAFHVAFIKADPVFDAFRGEQRFIDLLQKMKLAG